jgi:SHS2 domain-containing protein
LKDAFEQQVYGFFGFVTDSALIEIDDSMTEEWTITGDDLKSLLFKFMDEFLFHFSAEYFVVKDLEIISFDQDTFTIVVRAQGETFDLDKHTQGTEIKAITYSNMQIHENTQDQNRTDIYVIVDI